MNVTNQPKWVSRSAEEFLARTWLSDWYWSNEDGESGDPYDFFKTGGGPENDFEIYADAKSSQHQEHLQVSARWVATRVEKGFGDMSVIAVTWDARLKPANAFKALGWASVDRLAGYGLRTGGSRFRPENFIFMHKRELQPMRTMPT